MRVGIDLDGVVYNFGESLRQFLITSGLKTEDEVEAPITRWEFYEDWGMDLDEFKHCVSLGVNRGFIFAKGSPIPHTRMGWEMLRDGGHSIHIVTDRFFGISGEAQFSTIDWLSRHGLSFDSITFTSDKTVANVDVMVDDKPENWQALTEAGVPCFLMNRRWNQHVHGAVRVYDLPDYASIVDRMEIESAA